MFIMINAQKDLVFLNTKKHREKLDFTFAAKQDIYTINSQKISIDETNHSIDKQTLRKKPNEKQSSAKSNLKAIAQLYHVKNKDELLWFIHKHETITSLVLEAFDEIQKYFTTEVIELKVELDPDTNESQSLSAYILTSISAKEALKRLDDFDEEWFLDNLDRTDGLFNFYLKFI